jgi:hypothetical protein
MTVKKETKREREREERRKRKWKKQQYMEGGISRHRSKVEVNFRNGMGMAPWSDLEIEVSKGIPFMSKTRFSW